MPRQQPASAGRASPRRDSELLILEGDPATLREQGVVVGSVLQLVSSFARPNTSIRRAALPSLLELGRVVAAAQSAGRRVREVVFVAHGNDSGLVLQPGSIADWKTLAGTLRPLAPETLIFIACRAGRRAGARAVFSALPSLKEIYASPTNTTQAQAGLVALLRSAQAQPTVSDMRAGQLLTFLLTKGVVFRYQRQEILRSDLLDEVIGHLVEHVADRFESGPPPQPPPPAPQS